jgi:hypothetical protein
VSSFDLALTGYGNERFDVVLFFCSNESNCPLAHAN